MAATKAETHPEPELSDQNILGEGPTHPISRQT